MGTSIVNASDRASGGMGAHHTPSKKSKDEWLTPPGIVAALGDFDLDPCAPINRPWDTAKQHFTKIDDGLRRDWRGRVWLNPPYGRVVSDWVQKLADHGDGVALIFARTETEFFFSEVWKRASAILFLEGRLTFYHVNGEAAQHNGGAPSALIAYGARNVASLRHSGLAGALVVNFEVMGARA